MSEYTIYYLITTAVSVVIALLCGIFADRIGKEKGNKGFFWTGFFLGVIGLLIAVFSKDNSKENKFDNIEQKDIINGKLTEEINVNSPIDVYNWNIIKLKKELYGQFMFNIYNKDIVSVKFVVSQFNNKDEELAQIEIFQDITGDAKQYKSEGFLINENTTRLAVGIDKIKLKNDLNFCAIPEVIAPRSYNKFSKETYAAVHCQNKLLNCIPEHKDNYWRCSCGYPNSNNQDFCVNCGSIKNEVFETVTQTYIDGLTGEYEQAKIIQKAKDKKILIIFGAIMISIVLIVIIMSLIN